MTSNCCACMFAEVMADGAEHLPERERYAFAFCIGLATGQRHEPFALCPEHTKDVADGVTTPFPDVGSPMERN